MRASFLLASSLLTLLAQPVFAQTADGAAADEGLADIVVTAQRKAENLQDVPLAVTALDAHGHDPDQYDWYPILRRPRADGWTPARQRLFIETLVLAPLAAAMLLQASAAGKAAFGHDATLDLLLEANLLDELVDELFAPGGFWAEQE